MVKIRLARHGAKKRAFYRVVAADSRAPRDGRFVDLLGTYDPNKSPAEINLDLARVDYWLERGARPSQTADKVIKTYRRSVEASS